jgi:hypothetical protein
MDLRNEPSLGNSLEGEVHAKQQQSRHNKDADTHNGSPIWNHAQANRSIVQDYSFWEIRNGNQALFWEDAWQQSPKLDSPQLLPLKQSQQNAGRFTVSQYWSPNSEDQDWREWMVFDPTHNEHIQETIQDLNQRISKRKIRIAAENDKLRWGPKGNGNFSLKEARSIIEEEEQPNILPWATKVWDSLLWPKIRTFLWLLMQKRTLTWENLMKKGFRGPSRCPMCTKEEETMNHLLNSCEWASQLWNWMENILGASDRNRDSIQETITNWRSKFSRVNRVEGIWKSAPGFIVWTIWKERNRRIFKEEIRSLELAKESITINIKQLIQAKCKVEADEKPTIQDLQILKAFQLEASSNQPTGGNSPQPSSQILQTGNALLRVA